MGEGLSEKRDAPSGRRLVEAYLARPAEADPERHMHQIYARQRVADTVPDRECPPRSSEAGPSRRSESEVGFTAILLEENKLSINDDGGRSDGGGGFRACRRLRARRPQEQAENEPQNCNRTGQCSSSCVRDCISMRSHQFCQVLKRMSGVLTCVRIVISFQRFSQSM